MKSFFMVTLLCSVACHAIAQWNPNGATTGNIYYSGGNVGIGTNTPEDKLHLNGSMGVPFDWTLRETQFNRPIFQTGWQTILGDYISIKHGGNNSESGTMGIRISDGYGFEFGYNNFVTSLFNVMTNGNIGVGLTNPEGKLHVRGVGYFGNENGNSWHRVAIGGSAGDYGSVGYGFKYTTVNSQYTYAVADHASQLRFDLGGFTFRTAPVGTSGTNVTFTDVMKILQNGKVGIGTSNPSYNLQINSTASSNLRLVSNGASSGNPSIDLFDNVNGTEFVLSPSSGKVDLFTYSNHALAFGTANNEKMRINPNGYVGIGTTNPTQKLTVNGTVYSTEVKVDVSAGTGPDYVFEPTYQMPSLTEIENYIKTNKHLPEVPSAKEMETNGINLSEMNMLLLKKVEELTLHLIEQQKQNEKQQKEIEILKSRIK